MVETGRSSDGCGGKRSSSSSPLSSASPTKRPKAEVNVKTEAPASAGTSSRPAKEAAACGDGEAGNAEAAPATGPPTVPKALPAVAAEWRSMQLRSQMVPCGKLLPKFSETPHLLISASQYSAAKSKNYDFEDPPPDVTANVTSQHNNIGNDAYVAGDIALGVKRPVVTFNDTSQHNNIGADTYVAEDIALEVKRDCIRDFNPSATLHPNECQTFMDGLKQGVLSSNDIEVTLKNSPSYISEPEDIKLSRLENIRQVNWLKLPLGCIWYVWQRLDKDSDRIRFRLACREWYQELPVLAPRPCIMGSNLNECVFHSIQRNGLRRMKLQGKIPDGFCCGSTFDLLIIRSSCGSILWNLTQRLEVRLPQPSYEKIVMSRISDFGKSNAFAYSGGRVNLSFGRPADQSSWKEVVCYDRSIQDIAHCDNSFYALNRMFRLYKLNAKEGMMQYVGPEQSSDAIRKIIAPRKDPEHIFLAELSNELLVVAVWEDLHFVEVMKLVWVNEEMTSVTMVENLGNWSLFVGRNQSFALNADDFPGVHPNSVYIAIARREFSDVPPKVLTYSLQNRILEDLEFPSHKFGVPIFFYPGFVLKSELDH